MMKLNQELSLLKELSDLDQELISGGGTVFVSTNGTNISISSSASSSTTVDGVTTEEDSQSFSFGPASGSFSFTISSGLPRRTNFQFT